MCIIYYTRCVAILCYGIKYTSKINNRQNIDFLLDSLNVLITERNVFIKTQFIINSPNLLEVFIVVFCKMIIFYCGANGPQTTGRRPTSLTHCYSCIYSYRFLFACQSPSKSSAYGLAPFIAGQTMN